MKNLIRRVREWLNTEYVIGVQFVIRRRARDEDARLKRVLWSDHRDRMAMQYLAERLHNRKN